MTARLLAELHHDQEENHPAAETLQGVEKAFAGRSNHWQLLEPDTDGRDPLTLGMLRARMDFCEACHWKAQGALGRQRQCLDRALASDCYDIEVLIECYRMPDSTADYRGKIRALIAKRLCELREQAADFGENVAAAQPCNEFAWLAANTEGDLEEALRLAKRAIELVGEQGSYCDTLARVYFAKGEYANAVMHQTRAAELLPHVRAVQKQLALFRKKALEKGIPLETIPKLPKTAAPIPIEKSTAPDDNPFG
jgi:tetratricopeptide (TPR) repeat protein